MRTKHSTRIFIGIDNGVSGSIGIIIVSPFSKVSHFIPMPTFSQQNYTKAKKNITRVDHEKLYDILQLDSYVGAEIILERPMVNPTRFQATQSALRALEATLIILEELRLSISYIDSKEWQKVLLPQGTKGTPELKKASIDIGIRLFPEHREAITRHKDADGLLLAEYCRRTR